MNIEQFEKEVTCTYKNERYSVRDNGAILRHSREGKRIRKYDNIWTYGKINNKGYMLIVSEVVHRIVATAFHGTPPTVQHVVDHIDTNRQNNRPENLRWVTILENRLINPITCAKIIYKYGSIDNFLSNPSKPINGELEQNFEWMRAVTKEEAENTKQNLINWAKSGKLPKGGKLGEWIFSQTDYKKELKADNNLFTESLTANALQKNWKIKSEFPNCPKIVNDSSLKEYKEKLSKGITFSKNKYGESLVEDFAKSKTKNELIVLTKSENVKPYALAKVYIENEKFVHENIRGFFELNGARKQFNLLLGLEWNGADSIDDYC